MHVATGTTIVATADPYLGDEPFRIAEMVLDTASGEPLAGPDGDDATFGDAAAVGGASGIAAVARS